MVNSFTRAIHGRVGTMSPYDADSAILAHWQSLHTRKVGMAMKQGQPVRQRVGATVRMLREERRMTLGTVANAATISPSHLSRIERGRTVPGYDVLARIAEALGVELAALTAEERATRDIDTVIDALGLSDAARADLLRLAPATRAELATALVHG